MNRPTNLAELRESGWKSKTVKREIYDNSHVRPCRRGDDLFPGIVGYDDTVIPDIVLALCCRSMTCCSSEKKGRRKAASCDCSIRFLDAEIPYLDIPDSPVHDDPYQPITSRREKVSGEHP